MSYFEFCVRVEREGERGGRERESVRERGEKERVRERGRERKRDA